MSTTLRHSTDKRVIRTKKAIKSALFKLMETKELSSITISELTACASVNRRTFYTHYRCITDILNEIEGDLVQALSELLAKIDFSDYKASLYDLFIGLHEMVTGEFDYYFRIMHMDMRGLLFSRLKTALRSSSETLFGSLPEMPAHGNLITSFLAGGFFAFYNEWYYSEDRVPVEKAAEILSTLASSCINASEGIAD